MLQHTSTPYKIATLTEEGTDTIVLGYNNATVCETYYHWRSKEECEANAKFIIKACNEHSQLIEALQQILYEVKTNHINPEYKISQIAKRALDLAVLEK